MDPAIPKYNEKLEPADRDICDALAGEIDRGLSRAESRIWHGHPVWFLGGNSIVGYIKRTPGIRLPNALPCLSQMSEPTRDRVQ